MIAYLKLFEESYAQFPGFTNEIQGVFPEDDPVPAHEHKRPRALRAAIAIAQANIGRGAIDFAKATRCRSLANERQSA
jgi:hypothetical protein